MSLSLVKKKCVKMGVLKAGHELLKISSPDKLDGKAHLSKISFPKYENVI